MTQLKGLIIVVLGLSVSACVGGSLSFVGKACTAARRCPDGYVCKPDPGGVGGVCVMSTCSTGSDCGDGYICSSGQCLAAPGVACVTSDDCAGGHCVGGLCCDSACLGECERCDLVPGQCTPVALAETPACSIDGSGARMCDAGGSCVEPHRVADVNSDMGPTGIARLANGHLVFSQSTPTAGRELWTWTGTTAAPLPEIAPGRASGAGLWATAPFNAGFAVFDGTEPTHGHQLWTSDGVTIHRATDAAADESFVIVDMAEDWVYVVIGTFDLQAYTGALWRFNHTTAELVTNDISVRTGYSWIWALPVGRNNAGALYFYGNNAAGNDGLWKVQGTSVEPLCPWDALVPQTGHYGQNPLATLNGWLYFMGSDAAHGWELWRTDGASCERVTDIVAGAGNSGISNPTTDSQFVYLNVSNGTDWDLWRTDGTTTTLVHAGLRIDSEAVELAGWTYFAGTDAYTGTELWRVDASGAEQVADLDPGVDGSYPSQLVVSGGALFFSANDGVHGGEVWRVDGTPGGLEMWDVWPGEGTSGPTILGGGAFTFIVAATPDHGRELAYWESNGASRGVLDACPGTCGDISGSSFSGSTLVFGALTSADGSYQLQQVPLAGTTVQGLGVLGPGTGQGFAFVTNSAYFWRPNAATRPVEHFGNAYVFAGTSPLYGAELFQTDLTAAGTQLLFDFVPGRGGSTPAELTAVGDDLFFTVGSTRTTAAGLVVSDGTAGGTTRLVGQPTMTQAFSLMPLGDRLLFVATDSVHGTEPWVSDGTEAGTFLLRDIAPGISDAIPSFGVMPSSAYQAFATTGDRGFFCAIDSDGTGLWVTDGTTAGTIKVVEVYPGMATTGTLTPPTVFEDRAYFFAHDAGGVPSLWRSDGTAAGTLQVYAGSWSSSNAANLVAAANLLYFTVSDSSTTELWVSDGTATGTRAAAMIPGAADWTATVGGSLYFTTASVVDGSTSLWVSHGTDTTTFAVADIDPIALAASGSGLVAFHDRVFFGNAGNDGVAELYVSDGTTAGTIAACQAGLCMTPGGLWVVDDHLFASLSDGTGNELFVFP